jgi:hypothetical protein
VNRMIDQPCPQCKRGDLVERRNKRTGQSFYGCSRYPDCKFAVADLARLAPLALSPALVPADPLPNASLASNTELVDVLRGLTEAIAALTKDLKLHRNRCDINDLSSGDGSDTFRP